MLKALNYYVLDILFYIKDILLKRDGLVVPELGSFIVENLPSRIDQTNNKIIPPQKNIRFNDSITQDDDHILAHTLMQAENISFEKASQKIHEQVEQIRQALDQNNKFEIPYFGTIEKEESGSLRFRISEKDNKTLGLIEVEAEPFEQPEKKQTIKTDDSKKPTSKKFREKTKKKSYKFYWLAGIIVVFLGIAAATLYFDVWNLPQSQLTLTKKPEKEQPGKLQQQTSVSLPDTGKLGRINQTIDTITDKKQALMYKENNGGNEFSEQSGKSYHLIVGSFQRRKNAEEFCEQIKEQDFKPEIIAKDGLFRISVQSYNNKQQALVSLYHMRDTGKIKSVWLLTVSEKDQ